MSRLISSSRAAASGRTMVANRTIIPTIQNLLLQSEAFDNASWTKSGATVSANTVVNPVDGLTTADTLTATAGGTFHYVGNSQLARNGQGPYTFSCYVHRNNNDWISIMFPGNGFGTSVYFNTNTGVFSTNTSRATNLTVKALASSWYRISATFNAPINNGGGSVGPGIFLANANGSNSNNFSAAGTEAVDLFGAQLVQSNLAKPYVSTTSSAVNTGTPRLLASAT